MGDFTTDLLEFSLSPLILVVVLVLLPFLLNGFALLMRKVSGEIIDFNRMLKTYGQIFLVVFISVAFLYLGYHLQQGFFAVPFLTTLVLGFLVSMLVSTYFCLSIAINFVYIFLGKMGELRR